MTIFQTLVLRALVLLLYRSGSLLYSQPIIDDIEREMGRST